MDANNKVQLVCGGTLLNMKMVYSFESFSTSYIYKYKYNIHMYVVNWLRHGFDGFAANEQLPK